jgi:hypothetical protein
MQLERMLGLPFQDALQGHLAPMQGHWPAKWNVNSNAVLRPGDTVKRLLWRLRNGELPRARLPRVAAVLVGTHDIVSPECTQPAAGNRTAAELRGLLVYLHRRASFCVPRAPEGRSPLRMGHQGGVEAAHAAQSADTLLETSGFMCQGVLCMRGQSKY